MITSKKNIIKIILSASAKIWPCEVGKNLQAFEIKIINIRKSKEDIENIQN